MSDNTMTDEQAAKYAAPHSVCPKQSKWTCYLFGNAPGGTGLAWCPHEGEVPNVVVRWFMRVCLGCRWVKEKR